MSNDLPLAIEQAAEIVFKLTTMIREHSQDNKLTKKKFDDVDECINWLHYYLNNSKEYHRENNLLDWYDYE